MNTITRHRSHRILLSGLLALLLVAGCAGADEAGDANEQRADAPAKRSVRVETLVLAPTTFEDVIELTGSVEALNDATLSAQAAGTVLSLAPLGRSVQAGEAVAQLDPGITSAGVQQAEAQVAAAQAAFELAEDNLRRQEPLYRDSVISAIEFENVRAQYNQSQAQLNQARAALAQAREQLRNTRVTAPFSGTVEERFVEQGEQVTPGRQIARVVNTGRVKVTTGVPERYANDIRAGTPVQIRFQAAGPTLRSGRVTFAGRAIDPQSRTFPVEVELENRDGQLKPQMVARVYVTREQLADVIVVPRTAVIRDENGTSVFAVNRTADAAAAERRDVVLGSAYGGQAVVLSGLQAGDEIVVLGQNSLTQGDALQVVEQHRSLQAAGMPLENEVAMSPVAE